MTRRREHELKRVRTTFYRPTHHRDVALLAFGAGMLVMLFICALLVYGSAAWGW